MNHVKQTSEASAQGFDSAVSFDLCYCPIRLNYYFHLIDVFNCNLLNVVSKVPFYYRGMSVKRVCLLQRTNILGVTFRHGTATREVMSFFQVQKIRKQRARKHGSAMCVL